MSVTLLSPSALHPPFGDGSESQTGAWLWARVPENTRERDYAKARGETTLDEWGRPKGPLRQLIDVLATGFEAVKGDGDAMSGLMDIDACPDDFLPHLAAMFGFEFPYDLSVAQRRNYLHTIMSMYRTKGTAWTLRLAALRVIGEGFSLEITNEDYQAKTFDVEVTADQDAATSQTEQKLAYMVRQYSPAGMIPNIVVIYYLTEATNLRNRVSDGVHSATEESAWRMNWTGHLTNDKARTNDRGVLTLSI